MNKVRSTLHGRKSKASISFLKVGTNPLKSKKSKATRATTGWESDQGTFSKASAVY